MRIGVPVHVVNREASPGLKKGGAVNLVLHRVEVMAPADDIPESITIDLTGLDFHEFGARFRGQAARRLPADQRQGRSDGGDDRPADGDGRGDAGRHRRSPGRRRGRRTAAPAAGARAKADGRQGRRRAGGRPSAAAKK